MGALSAGAYNAAPSSLQNGAGTSVQGAGLTGAGVVYVPMSFSLSSVTQGHNLPGSNRYLCIVCSRGEPGVIMVKNTFGMFEVYCNSCATYATRSVQLTDLFHMPDYTAPALRFQDANAINKYDIMGRASCMDCRSGVGKVTLATEFVYYKGNDHPSTGLCASHFATFAAHSSGGIGIRIWTSMTYSNGCPRDRQHSRNYYFP
jgi:hypothetical protein